MISFSFGDNGGWVLKSSDFQAHVPSPYLRICAFRTFFIFIKRTEGSQFSRSCFLLMQRFSHRCCCSCGPPPSPNLRKAEAKDSLPPVTFLSATPPEQSEECAAHHQACCGGHCSTHVRQGFLDGQWPRCKQAHTHRLRVHCIKDHPPGGAQEPPRRNTRGPGSAGNLGVIKPHFTPKALVSDATSKGVRARMDKKELMATW